MYTRTRSWTSLLTFEFAKIAFLHNFVYTNFIIYVCSIILAALIIVRINIIYDAYCMYMKESLTMTSKKYQCIGKSLSHTHTVGIYKSACDKSVLGSLTEAHI